MYQKTPLQCALDLLKLRDRSEFEIRKKMREKEFLPEEIDNTVKFLFDKKFLDDDRFTEIYVRSQRSIGRNGKVKIRMKLKNLGVADETINKYLSSDSENDDELENAQEVVKKWLRTKSNTPKEKIREKLFRHLAGRGFEYDVIMKVVNNI